MAQKGRKWGKNKKLFEGCRKILAKYYGHYLMTIGVKQTK